MKKQTPLEFFIIKLIEVCGAPPDNTWKEFSVFLKQAKEMEKQQLLDFYREGYLRCNSHSLGFEKDGSIITSTLRLGELYYNEIYLKNNN